MLRSFHALESCSVRKRGEQPPASLRASEGHTRAGAQRGSPERGQSGSVAHKIQRKHPEVRQQEKDWGRWGWERAGEQRQRRATEAKGSCTLPAVPGRGGAGAVSVGLWWGCSEGRQAGGLAATRIWVTRAQRHLMPCVGSVVL